MKTLNLIIGLLFANLLTAQTYNVYHQGIVDNATLANITTNLNEFVAFGEKNAFKTTAKYNNLVDAKNWLKAKYQTFGYTDIVEDNFTENGRTVTNIVVTKIGEVYPNEFIIIDGHYDTLNGVGANDNGSGTTLLLEIARVMANVPTAYSIKFINFSVEEQGLLGSDYYANNTGAGLDIRYVFNIDEVGGVAGMTNNIIVCERDEGSPTVNNAASAVLTNELATSIELYSSLSTEISNAYASDYMPFEDNGEIITGLYEKNETAHAHSSTDIIANMDIPYVFEVTKGALGALLHFADADVVLSTENSAVTMNTIKIFPNPVSDNVFVKFDRENISEVKIKMINVLGKEVYYKIIQSPKHVEKLNIDKLTSGVYFMSIQRGTVVTTQKIVIK